MSTPCFVIAEAGVNHNGDSDLALRLVDVAADAGADAVKFQTFSAERLVSRDARKARYQQETTGAGESQFDMLRRLELSAEAHRLAAARASERGIEFMSTPFDKTALDFLRREIGIRRIKIPSGEITNGPLILHAARSGLPVILSTGMSTLGEIAAALAVLAFGYAGSGEPGEGAFAAAFRSPEGQAALRSRVHLLHCTSAYPAPFADVNLRAMDSIAAAFGLPVGYSDHTTGIAVAHAAVARGATVIEKHFTLDRSLPGPDHPASLEPGELRALVEGVRAVEAALGIPLKIPSRAEAENVEVARKRLVALRDVPAGQILTAADIGARRPGDGVSPMRYWAWLGRPAPRDLAAGEPLEE